jgi:endonuclease/exonuclease/phosphatase family metal-dependent hydrolase
MRAATLNLWGRHGDWEARRKVLIDGFRTLAPDVVALQESVMTTAYDQVVDLLGEGFHIAHQGRRVEEGTGCSIASRWPFAELREVDLLVTHRVDPEAFGARTTVAEIDAPDGRFLFANHKPSWQSGLEHERELQAVTAARFIEDMRAGRDLPVVVAGDFDAMPDSASVRFWAGRQSLDATSVCYRDAWELRHPGVPGPTFSSENPLRSEGWPGDLDRRIDYIFVRANDRGPAYDVTACERIFDAPVDGVWASDHFGVYADLVPR